jgi:pyrroloquinoline quinone (PQQ) biosynthesis protein C
MKAAFQREGELKDLASYPGWLQEVIAETSDARAQIVKHPLFADMRDARLSVRQFAAFLVNGWPVVEQFPQYMAMNLMKLRDAHSRGEAMARRYLTRNIRVEQNHADYWLAWCAAHDVSRDKLAKNDGPSLAYALSHWCWKSSSADPLAASIAATNYAIEGITGEWSALVCSRDTYEMSLPEPVRKRTIRWLKLHAHYDDAHPWEALEIVATLLGNAPRTDEIAGVRDSIFRSLEYFKVSLDCCL